MKVVLLLTVAAVAAATCPKLACTEYLDSGICGFRNADVLLVRPCEAGQSCTPPRALGDSSLLTCSPAVDTSRTQYLCELRASGFISFVREGENCNHPTTHCFDEEGLVCQNVGFGPRVCVKGGIEGESCTDKDCAWGSSCLAGMCTNWFTQGYGVKVPDPWLCETMTVDSNGACLRPDKNSHDIFEPCEQDSDCTGVNGTRGHCRCGVLGLAYCDLKSNDKPFEQLKLAYKEKSVRDVLYWQHVVDNWAFLQRNDGNFEEFAEFPACADKVWPEFDFQLRAIPAVVDFASAELLSLGLFYLFT